jgi:hypothetical protein
MPKIYVPPSEKNEAMKIFAEVAGKATIFGTRVAWRHHDEIVKRLKEGRHSHVVKEDHEAAPANHHLVSTTS